MWARWEVARPRQSWAMPRLPSNLGLDRGRKGFRLEAMQHVQAIDQVGQHAELEQAPPVLAEQRLPLLVAERIGGEELGLVQAARIRVARKVDDCAVDRIARGAGRRFGGAVAHGAPPWGLAPGRCWMPRLCLLASLRHSAITMSGR